jgi:uncharacterized protein (DUF305 family)
MRPHTMRRAIGALALVLVGAAGLAACGEDDGGSDGASESGHNNADVEFAQGMIPHHEQAIEMAQLAEGRVSSPEVKQLAADIEAAQDPEIETMTGWLEDWGEDVPSGGSMEGMDHGDMSGDNMPGMMSDADMEELESASDAEFDQMFLTMMIEHHEGAIEMARAERSDGEYAEAVDLAKKIETDQTAEIATMEKLLE